MLLNHQNVITMRKRNKNDIFNCYLYKFHIVYLIILGSKACHQLWAAFQQGHDFKCLKLSNDQNTFISLHCNWWGKNLCQIYSTSTSEGAARKSSIIAAKACCIPTFRYPRSTREFTGSAVCDSWPLSTGCIYRNGSRWNIAHHTYKSYHSVLRNCLPSTSKFVVEINT